MGGTEFNKRKTLFVKRKKKREDERRHIDTLIRKSQHGELQMRTPQAFCSQLLLWGEGAVSDAPPLPTELGLTGPASGHLCLK